MIGLEENEKEEEEEEEMGMKSNEYIKKKKRTTWARNVAVKIRSGPRDSRAISGRYRWREPQVSRLTSCYCHEVCVISFFAFCYYKKR